MTQPAPYLALDLETCAVPEPQLTEIIEREMKDWTPPVNIRDAEKIEARREEHRAKLRERSALLDLAPIACVAVRTPAGGIVFNGLDRKPNNQVVSSGTERQVLVDLRNFLNLAANESTIIIGFNLMHFDLPKLRGAYLRHRLRLPAILSPAILDDAQQPAVDVMRVFVRFYAADRAGQPFVSLAEVAERLALPGYKAVVDGSDVPRLIAAGHVQDVLTYCALDTAATLAAYLLLSGATAGLS